MMTMDSTAEKVVEHYAQAYQRLYKREPRDLQMIDNDWVMVNGARMRVRELEYLTQQLQLEYHQGLQERKNMVQRLVKWFKGF